MNKIIFNVLLISLLFLNACSKKNEVSEVKSSSNKLSDIALLKRLPQETFAFAILRTGDNEFKQYIERMDAEAKLTEIVSTISQASPELEVSLKAVADTIKKIIPLSAGSQSKTDLVITFLSGNTKDNISGGILLHSNDDNFFQTELAAITNTIQKTNNASISSPAPGKIVIKNSAQKDVFIINHSGQFLVAASNQTTVDKLLNSDTKNPFIPSGENFEKIKAKFDSGDKEIFTFSYADLNRVYSIFPVNTLVPEQFKPLLSLLPEALAWQASISNTALRASFSALIKEASISEAFKDALKNPSNTGFFHSASKEAAIALSLNTKLVKSLADFFISISDMQEQLKEFPGKLSAELETGLLLNSNPKAGLADISLFLPLSDPAWAINLIKEQSTTLTQGQGMGANWNIKEISGKNVDYLMSPFGIGLYLLSDNKYLIAGISEDSIKNAFLKQTETIGNSAALKLNLQSPTSVFKFYINHLQLYNMLLGIKNFASIFMGNQPNPYFDNLEDIKKFNQTGISSSYQDNLLSFDSAYTFNPPSLAP